MGLRYGLLAALTLVLASALIWDRLHPTAPGRLADRHVPDPADLAVLVVGGTPGPEPAPPAPPAPTAPAGVPGAAPGTPAAPRESEYTVESGDTLGQIASRTLGSSRRAADLARYNGFDLDTPIRVGQVLRIPPDAPATEAPAVARAPAAPPVRTPASAAPAPTKRKHTVGKGETFYGIARRVYGDGGRWRDIASANGLDPDGPLPVGRELLIP